MHHWNSVDWTYGGGFIMGLGMLLIWLIPLGLLAALVMHFNNQNRTPKQPETAMELLEKAYARGEINRNEFLQRKADLLGTEKTVP